MLASPAIRLLYAACLVAFVATSASAQDPFWAEKMLNRKDFKFGSVAKGGDATLRLTVKNIYKEDIQITEIGTGCSCVKWDEKPADGQPFSPIVVPSGKEVSLTLRLDTVRYDGERKSVAKVSLYEPIHAAAKTVELPVEAYIRKDIVLSPGSVNFGAVDLGKGAEQRVAINYAGRSDWNITQAKTNNVYLKPQLVEKSRGNGLVNYELIVTLKPETPVGGLRDQITLATDDTNNPQISVLVEAKVEADIVVTDLQFGSVIAGQTKTMNVVIRGRKPIKIEKIERTKADESFKVTTPAVATTQHILPLKFTPPNEPGLFEEEFFVTIAGREEPITFKAKGRIVGSAAKN